MFRRNLRNASLHAGGTSGVQPMQSLQRRAVASRAVQRKPRQQMRLVCSLPERVESSEGVQRLVKHRVCEVPRRRLQRRKGSRDPSLRRRAQLRETKSKWLVGRLGPVLERPHVHSRDQRASGRRRVALRRLLTDLRSQQHRLRSLRPQEIRPDAHSQHEPGLREQLSLVVQLVRKIFRFRVYERRQAEFLRHPKQQQ